MEINKRREMEGKKYDLTRTSEASAASKQRGFPLIYTDSSPYLFFYNSLNDFKKLGRFKNILHGATEKQENVRRETLCRL